MSVYVYLRQSSGDEERSISCEQQKANCQHIADLKKLFVDGVYQDLNTSGRLYWSGAENLAEMDFVYQSWINETKKKNKFRVGLGNLFAVLKKKDIIIVDDITRLYRPLTNSYLESALIQFLLSKEIKIFTVKNGELNLNSFNDTLINALQNRINDNQLALQRKKSMDSFKRLKDSGEHLQAIPTTWGYRGTGRKFEVEVVEEEAKFVKHIFKAYINGDSVYKIVRDLNIAFHTHTTPKTIRDIVARPLYAGYYYNSNGELIKAKEIEGKEIIDFNTWKEANDILQKRRTFKSPMKKNTYFFNGITKCGVCGSILSIVINNKIYYALRCKRHMTTEYPPCKVSIGLNSVFKYGLGMNAALQPILCLGLLKQLNEEKNQKQIQEQIEQKTIELNNIQNKEKQLSSMFLEGLLSEDVLKQSLASNKSKKDALQRELIDLQQQTGEVDLEELRELTLKIFHRKQTNEEYSRLVHKTFKEIKVYPDKIEVITFWGSFTLPRRQIKTWKMLPHYTWSNEPNNYKLYYHWGLFKLYSKQIKLLDLGYFKIFMQEDDEGYITDFDQKTHDDN